MAAKIRLRRIQQKDFSETTESLIKKISNYM